MLKVTFEMRFEKACRNREELDILRSASATRYKQAVALINTMLNDKLNHEVIKKQLEIIKLRARDFRSETLMQMELLEAAEDEEAEVKLNNFQRSHNETLKRVQEALMEKTCFICKCKHEENPEKCTVFVMATPDQRAKIVAENRRCLRCIVGEHMSRDCAKPPKCTKRGCQLSHHWMLHGAGRVFEKRVDIAGRTTEKQIDEISTSSKVPEEGKVKKINLLDTNVDKSEDEETEESSEETEYEKKSRPWWTSEYLSDEGEVQETEETE